MSETTAKLLEQIRSLPEEDQQFIADELRRTLGDDGDELWDDTEFRAEIERRSDSVADGTADLKPWDQARAEMGAELDRRAALRQNSGEPS